MSPSSSIVLALALSGGVAASNVTQLTTAAVEIGASTTTGGMLLALNLHYFMTLKSHDK